MSVARQLSLLVTFVLVISMISYGVMAVKLPAASVGTVADPGEKKTVKLALFSDKNMHTRLYFDSEGDDYSILSFKPYTDLPPNTTVFLDVNVSVPTTAQPGSYFSPKIRVKEGLQTDVASYSILQEVSKDILVSVFNASGEDSSQAVLSEASGGSSSGISSDSSGSSTQTVLGSDNSSGLLSSTSNESEELQSVSILSGTTPDTSSSKSSIEVSEASNQTMEVSGDSKQETGWIIDGVVCIPESTNPDCGKSFCREAELTETIRLHFKVFGSEKECKKELAEERKEEKGKRKIAKRIEKLREKVVTKSLGESDSHEFDLGRNLRKVEIQLSSVKSDVELTVDTLAVSRVDVMANDLGTRIEVPVDETLSDGTVNTPISIVPEEQLAEEEKNSFIEIDGTRIPDIEKVTVKDEVVGETEKGEVLRKVTKKKAYKYLEIEVSGADKSEISGAKIEFGVEKRWMIENGISDPSLVRLNRFVDNWIELPTNLTGEDRSSYYFSAESEGFSFFVITAAITADIATPISVDIPEESSLQETETGNLASDLLGTSKPTPLLTVNISWIFAVLVLGIIILVKWNAIKQAMGWGHSKSDRIKQLEAERARYEKMKEETTKKFYKRIIGEEEFKTLAMEYDKNIISLETQIAELKGEKKE